VRVMGRLPYCAGIVRVMGRLPYCAGIVRVIGYHIGLVL